MNRDALTKQLAERLRPVFEKFAASASTLIAARVDKDIARFDELLAGALADYSKDASDVEVEKPARGRAVDRADVQRRPVRKAAKARRAAAAKGDRARALPREVAPAASSTASRKEAIAAAVKGKRSCSKCGEPGRKSNGCGITHNIGNRDTKPANAIRPEAPPPTKLDRYSRIEAAASARKGASQ